MTGRPRPLDVSALAAFSDEVRASAPKILAALDEARHTDASPDAAREAFRLIHALKGAASMVGLAALSHILNLAEELLDAPVADGTPVDPEVLDLLRSTMPKFATYVETARRGECDATLALELSQTYRAYKACEDPLNDPELMELLEIERSGFERHARAVAEGAGTAVPPAPPAVDDVPPALPAVDEAPFAPPPVDDVPLAPTAVDLASPAPQPVDEDLDFGPSEPVPQELAEVFAQEAQEHLQTIARLTAHVAGAPDDREALQELRRSVHTIKGAAGIVGYKAASRLAHRMEDLLDRLYDGTASTTPETTRLITSSSDALDDLITGTPADPATVRATLGRLFAAYDRLMGAEPPVSAPAVPRPGPDASVSEAGDGSVARPAQAPERRTGPDRRRSVEDRRRGGSQVVRIPFERLGELVRSVSELVINRSSFDQHFAGLVNQVDELNLSAARLRRLALKLETDYEVRALAGSVAQASAEVPGGHGFDELEFDRYTDFHLLSRELAETASDINTVSTRLSETIGNFDGDLTRLGRLTREVQDKVMEFRMVPLVTLAARLERAVRVTAEECGKAVDLVLEGENVALDKTLLEEMSDPLLHLLRNAVDHGIETPSERLAAGKPERGRIVVRASHEGTDVLIEVEDDGAGFDFERIRRAAVERGRVAEADAGTLTEEELVALVFEPGFSTARRLSEVSGRGVGLDIVKTKVARLGGRLSIASRPNAGAALTVRVPMTLAITRILLVRAGGQTVGLPLGAVLQIVRPDIASLATVGTERVVTVDDRTYPMRDLAALLDLPRSAESPSARPVLIANLGGRRLALAVDEIVQSRDAVVKTLGTHLRRVPGVWGATLLGDGTVILILNPTDLAGVADQPRVRAATPRAMSSAELQSYTVLVVDDSLSMRHVLSSALKKVGWNPVPARDGVEALEIVQRGSDPPDLVLLDIEMPRMDGYEFLATIRAQGEYAGVPIVMLTSRGGDKHREKAMALGATGYIVKPFQEEALIQQVGDLIRASRTRQKMAS
ncbi:MAG TPA: response regulator [Vicinamibacterales bacterium]|nr:response regulator [Vicinamibacterales bacterium]